MVTIRIQRSVNATILDEIILIDKDQVNVRGRTWQNMCRFTSKLTWDEVIASTWLLSLVVTSFFYQEDNRRLKSPVTNIK